jgi:cytochrome c peroxidase
MRRTLFLTHCSILAFAACSEQPAVVAESEPAEVVVVETTVAPETVVLRERAGAIIGVLPDGATNPFNPVTDAKIELGRILYFDPRLSKNQEVSCNSCHDLANAGVDGEATSPGHRGQRGDRNSPTVYNAALHVAQFWDGRAADVEEQAKGPVLNPVEMAMASEADVVSVLASIPGYAPLFAAAFPGELDPITFDNMARAIGAFERRLITSDRLDAFLSGQDSALDADELAGLEEFLDAGCVTCHMGPTIGGTLYRKLGLVSPFQTDDPGRLNVTKDEADRQGRFDFHETILIFFVI